MRSFDRGLHESGHFSCHNFSSSCLKKELATILNLGYGNEFSSLSSIPHDSCEDYGM